MNRNLKSVSRLIRMALLAALAGLLPPAAQAATITVNSTAQEVTLATPSGVVNGNCTIGEAILAANTNAVVDGCTAGQAGLDTIIIPAGTYSFVQTGVNLSVCCPANFPFALPFPSQAVIFQGAGAASTILELSTAPGTPSMNFMHTNAPVTVNDVTLRGFNLHANPGVEIGGVFTIAASPFAPRPHAARAPPGIYLRPRRSRPAGRSGAIGCW